MGSAKYRVLFVSTEICKIGSMYCIMQCHHITGGLSCDPDQQLVVDIIGASRSKPHTRDENVNFCAYV